MVRDIKQIKYANSFLPANAVYEGGSPDKAIPIVFSFYFIETENRRILVDAGCDTMPDFIMKDFILPNEALIRNGIDPLSITDVIITHSHHDHIDGLRHFKNTTVYIQTDEYNVGKEYIPDGVSIVKFDSEYILDKCIKAVKIGGHSIGSCIVELEYHSEKYVIVGDECYSEYNIINKIPTATSVNPENSRKFIDKYARDEYKLLLLH